MKYKEICDALIAAEVPYAKGTAIELLIHFFDVSRSDILMTPDKDYKSPELDMAISRRASGEPLEYITGVAHFYNEKYKVTKDCLIPRSDTEIIVERACRDLKKGSHFADICTGSGCIAVSTLANRSDVTATLVDISKGALALARENAAENKVDDRCRFVLADVMRDDALKERVDAIISNPPYISSDVIDTLSREVLHEPRIALDGGPDGLDFYRCIIRKYTKLLSDDGFFLFEIGYDQGIAIKELASKMGFDCEIFADYGGNDRGAKLTKR